MNGVEKVATDFASLFMDPAAWWAWFVAVMVAALAGGVGWLVVRRAQLLPARAAALDLVAISMGIGLIAVAAGYAAVKSGGASAFTPSAIALFIALCIGRGSTPYGRARRSTQLVILGLAGAAWLVAIVHGTTIAPSPRDATQPLEFMDEAYYSVLSVQLAETGLESIYGPSGTLVDDAPSRTWYHWGELWLAGLSIDAAGVHPMHSRHQVVLPLLVATASILAGALGARMSPLGNRREAAILSAFGMVTVAPMPFYIGLHFDWWARPIGYSITHYGLAYVAALLLVVLLLRPPKTRSGRLVVGALAGSLVASHVLIAVTAAIGLATALVLRWTWTRGWSPWPTSWSGSVVLVLPVAMLTTTAWGAVTGHGLGASSPIEGIEPFDRAWWGAMLFVLLGAGVLLLGSARTLFSPGPLPAVRFLTVGACLATAAGSIMWGIRLADFNSFHAFFGPLAVLWTPLAVAGVVRLFLISRAHGRRLLAVLVLGTLFVQGGWGAVTTVERLFSFGPGHYQPVPLTILDAIRHLPKEAKLAYRCSLFEEAAVWDARLISITAHTGRRVVPMCFQADIFGPQLGLAADPTRAGPFFAVAPQRSIYPTHDSSPSRGQVLDFLREHQIGYLLVTPDHPLIPGVETTRRTEVNGYAVHAIE
jgi:hypothetical protein